MSGAVWRILTLLVALTFAACGDGADEAPAADAGVTAAPGPRSGVGSTATADAAPPSTTTAPSTPRTTTPPYSFDGSVPPPEIVDTGDDYEAIYRSLSAYRDWLKAHHPVPERAADVMVVGSSAYARLVDNLDVLQAESWRVFDVEDSLSVEVSEVSEGLVTLVLVETVHSVMSVNFSGEVVDQANVNDSLRYIATMIRGVEGHWRIADVTRTGAGTEVAK